FEEVGLGDKGRWEYLRAIYSRYRAAGRKAKKVILNEFCANTDYNRKYAIRLLNGPRPEKHPSDDLARLKRQMRRAGCVSAGLQASSPASWTFRDSKR